VIPPKDWNEEWERTFESIEVDEIVQVIAPFKQPDPRFSTHLIIQPKMSFGTGHHETTRLMIRQMMELNFSGKSVLDMGCGSGILAIFAAKLGASPIVGIDIDQWSYINSIENMALNQVVGIEFLQGTASHIPDACYDIILANINRNVLLEDLAAYRSHLSTGGVLVVSGFLLEDEAVILQHFQANGFQRTRTLSEGEWLSIAFILEQQ
jgi:ribosomal protein L11 methyltransferase